jgi:hypothetical protein
MSPVSLIGLPHHGRYLSPISRASRVYTFGVDYTTVQAATLFTRMFLNLTRQLLSKRLSFRFADELLLYRHLV